MARQVIVPSTSLTIAYLILVNSCDGTYVENCDPSRAHYNIRELLTEQGATSTLDYMQQFWLNADGTNEHFWNHEWATHGTCYSTIQPSCLQEGGPEGSEVGCS
jgi:ribonuclease T2